MKKITFTIIILALVFFVSGCFKKSKDKDAGADLAAYQQSRESIIGAFAKNQELKDKGMNKQDIAVMAREDYEVFSVLSSHDRKLAVYTEVKGNIDTWEYHISIKDLESGESRVIYSYPESSSWQTSLRDFFVEPALAADCQALPFPLTWTKNDAKIIFEALSPIPCDGTKQGFGYFIADSEDGLLEPLRYIGFFDNYSKAIVLESGDKVICNSMNVFVNEEVLARDLETGEMLEMAADADYHYRFLGINKEMNVLNLERVKVYNNKQKGCYEFISKGEGVEILLDKFIK